MSRKVHLVGTIPGESAGDAIEATLSRLAEHLERLTDGETGARSWWIRASIDNFFDHPDLELARDGDYSSYDRTPLFRLKQGRELSADTVEPRIVVAPAFEASYPLFQQLRAKYGRPDLSFQVGVPAHVDLAIDVLGEAGFAPANNEACLEATARHVRRVHDEAGDDVIFQVETVIPLIAVAGAPEAAQAETAAGMARRIVELPRRVPERARFGLHLCLGDMNHKAYGHMRDIRPLVLLANELARLWPEERPLEYIHGPFAAAEEPPTFDERFYEPLRELRLPDRMHFIAGCVHESLSLDDERRLLALIEGHLNRPVDLAAACGLGRRPDPSQAWDAMEKAAELVNAPGP